MTPADLARAKKLYGMTTSSFPQEAATARRKLKELLAQHGKTVAGFAAELKREEAAKAKAEAEAQAAKNPPPPQAPPIQVPQAHIDLVAAYLVFNFQRDWDVDLRPDMIAMARIKEAAKQAIFKLMVDASASIILPYIAHSKSGTPMQLIHSLTQAEFKQLLTTPAQPPPSQPPPQPPPRTGSTVPPLHVELVTDYLISEFKREHDIDLRHDMIAVQRVNEAADYGINALLTSAVWSVKIEVPFI